MERRIEQPDGDRQARHDLEQLDEILALHGQDLGQRGAAAGFSLSARIISRMAHDAVGIEEHVLGAAEADAFGAEIARGAGIERGFGIGAHFHAARRRRPSP